MRVLTFNSLEVRLAETEAEVVAAQALRYRVFYEEMGARPTPRVRASRLDFDPYDEFYDHILVIDRASTEPGPRVVGTYRMMRRSVAEENAGFYSEGEFDVGPLLRYPGEVLELGRSCIDAAYRKRGAMQILWRGIAEYVFHHRIQVMFGCASLPGTRPEDMARPLSYLYHNHLARQELRPRALESRYVEMGFLPKDALDAQAARNELPPLIKGYLQLGGCVGDGAVVDSQFNTLDVCMVVETDQVTDKYLRHYMNAARTDHPEDQVAT